MKKFLCACAVMALASACSNVQRLVIRSIPDGAEISIVKRGQLQSSGGVRGVVSVGTSAPYEDPPVVIGKSPVAYDVWIIDNQGGFNMLGVSASQDKICQEVTIRASLDGRYAEQIIPVRGGEEATVFLQLPPAPPQAPAQPPQEPKS